jgi:vacuolar-type H+-ATPase subunit E/Vma4
VNESSDILKAQLQALLSLVEEHRESRCNSILDHARSQAALIIRQAHASARKRMRQAVREERNRGRDALQAARARLRSRAREKEQRALQRLLEREWPVLRRTLAERWQKSGTRARWLEALLQRASRTLPSCVWEVRHPQGWNQDDMDAVRQTIQSATGHTPRFVVEPRITAGLVICAQGTCVDGSLDGLLADRARIEGELLAMIRKEIEQRGPE